MNKIEILKNSMKSEYDKITRLSNSLRQENKLESELEVRIIGTLADIQGGFYGLIEDVKIIEEIEESSMTLKPHEKVLLDIVARRLKKCYDWIWEEAYPYLKELTEQLPNVPKILDEYISDLKI